jgi:hypothetical protein
MAAFRERYIYEWYRAVTATLTLRNLLVKKSRNRNPKNNPNRDQRGRYTSRLVLQWTKSRREHFDKGTWPTLGTKRQWILVSIVWVIPKQVCLLTGIFLSRHWQYFCVPRYNDGMAGIWLLGFQWDDWLGRRTCCDWFRCVGLVHRKSTTNIVQNLLARFIRSDSTDRGPVASGSDGSGQVGRSSVPRRHPPVGNTLVILRSPFKMYLNWQFRIALKVLGPFQRSGIGFKYENLRDTYPRSNWRNRLLRCDVMESSVQKVLCWQWHRDIILT